MGEEKSPLPDCPGIEGGLLGALTICMKRIKQRNQWSRRDCINNLTNRNEHVVLFKNVRMKRVFGGNPFRTRRCFLGIWIHRLFLSTITGYQTNENSIFTLNDD